MFVTNNFVFIVHNRLCIDVCLNFKTVRRNCYFIMRRTFAAFVFNNPTKCIQTVVRKAGYNCVRIVFLVVSNYSTRSINNFPMTLATLRINRLHLIRITTSNTIFTSISSNLIVSYCNSSRFGLVRLRTSIIRYNPSENSRCLNICYSHCVRSIVNFG